MGYVYDPWTSVNIDGCAVVTYQPRLGSQAGLCVHVQGSMMYSYTTVIVPWQMRSASVEWCILQLSQQHHSTDTTEARVQCSKWWMDGMDGVTISCCDLLDVTSPMVGSLLRDPMGQI